jgi:two-component system cell cycle sensor histidine kinase/response regulator CckA
MENLPPGVLDSLAEGCQVIGPDWTYLYLNSAAALQGRRNRSDLLGKSMLECYPGIEQTPMFAVLRRCMEQRIPQRMENEFTYPDGSSGWFELRFERVPAGVFILSLDISEQKRAAGELLRLSTAIQQAGEAVFIADGKGTLLYVNPAFETITGYAKEEVIGRNPRILRSGRQDAGFYRELWATVTSGETWRGRFVNRRKDGNLFTQETSISPVKDAAGKIVSYVGVGRDVTAELRLEADLRQALKMETVGRLAGGIAHDFNNLLSVILAYADFAMERLQEGDPLRADIQSMRDAGERAAGLTRQLLAFSRKQILQPRPLNLNDVVGGMRDMLRRLIGEHIELATVLAPNLGWVLADSVQIEQVVMNLTSNARDAMPEGGRLTVGTANVDLDEAYAGRHVAVTPGRYVMLSVSDTGTGMDEVTRERIFEPFFTTKAAGVGTGLGLATVYGIVKQSGGNIWVYSELGRGTTFKIYLPLVTVEGNTPPAAVNPSIKASAGETILVVEDAAPVRAIAQRILNAEGYIVLAAANGAQALSVCEHHAGPVHLLLTDVVMPEMSGVELAGRLTKVYPRLKTLFMSGYTDDAIVHHGVLNPETHFLGKPFDSAALRRKVREVLG